MAAGFVAVVGTVKISQNSTCARDMLCALALRSLALLYGASPHSLAHSLARLLPRLRGLTHRQGGAAQAVGYHQGVADERAQVNRHPPRRTHRPAPRHPPRLLRAYPTARPRRRASRRHERSLVRIRQRQRSAAQRHCTARGRAVRVMLRAHWALSAGGWTSSGGFVRAAILSECLKDDHESIRCSCVLCVCVCSD